MDLFRCIGFTYAPRLERAVRDRGYGFPWEMPSEEFADMKEALTLWEGAVEFARIARALHAEGDIVSSTTAYGEDFAFEDAGLTHQLRWLRPGDRVKVYRAVGRDDPNPIRPGDWVAMERRYAKLHGASGYRDAGGSKILEKTVRVEDVAWAGTSVDEWIYAPVGCRDAEMGVHEFLVGYALSQGLPVPVGVAREYPDLEG